MKPPASGIVAKAMPVGASIDSAMSLPMNTRAGATATPRLSPSITPMKPWPASVLPVRLPNAKR